MQTIVSGYKGVSLLFRLNWDFLICMGTLTVALILACWISA